MVHEKGAVPFQHRAFPDIKGHCHSKTGLKMGRWVLLQPFMVYSCIGYIHGVSVYLTSVPMFRVSIMVGEKREQRVKILHDANARQAWWARAFGLINWRGQLFNTRAHITTHTKVDGALPERKEGKEKKKKRGAMLKVAGSTFPIPHPKSGTPAKSHTHRAIIYYFWRNGYLKQFLTLAISGFCISNLMTAD